MGTPQRVTIERATAADVDAVVAIVNAAYAAGEAGIWLDGWQRTDADDIAAFIARGETFVARREDGAVVGSVRARRLTSDTAELGMLAVAPEGWGGGVGRALIDHAERAYPALWMELELLIPRAPHVHKQRLHEWYSRLGYAEAHRRDFASVYPGELLAAPADLVTYRKRLI